MVDKNLAVIEFLLNCPTIQDNPLFFNFAHEEAGSNHFITERDTVKRRFIDGSVEKQYTFTIASYSSVSHVAISDITLANENVENMAKVQAILDWINDEAEQQNFPDLGTDCIIESMETLQSDPDIDGIDTSVNPPIARYSVGVRLTYLDKSKLIWN